MVTVFRVCCSILLAVPSTFAFTSIGFTGTNAYTPSLSSRSLANLNGFKFTSSRSKGVISQTVGTFGRSHHAERRRSSEILISLTASTSDIGNGGAVGPSPLIPAERYSSADWLRSLLTLPKSKLLRRVASQLFGKTLFASLVWAAYVTWPHQLHALTVGLNPQHMLLLGNALALLLVFRTNTAYDRFWEARRLWGFLISRIREVIGATVPRSARGSARPRRSR